MELYFGGVLAHVHGEYMRYKFNEAPFLSKTEANNTHQLRP